MPLFLTKYIMESGERYALLIDEDGIPVFLPTLYITCKVRNADKATSTADQHLAAIKIFIEFCQKQNVPIDIEERIRTKQFLTAGEIDALRDACRKKRTKSKSTVVAMKKGYTPPNARAKSTTTYIYLSRIASYLDWLCKHLLGTRQFTRETSFQIDRFIDEIRSRRPAVPGRNVDDESARGITDEQEQLLFEVTQPGHPGNPFSPAVQFRNYLILKLLRLLGPRGGEVFNLQVEDFDFTRNQVSIVRRAGARKDPRVDQALVKTRQRILPVAPSTMAEVRRYITEFRKRIPNAKQNPYLLVTHKSGPTQGQPLSLSSLQYIFDVIGEAYPELAITAHDLRHRWNVVYSEAMDKTTRSHEEVEQSRNFLEGWTPGSKQGQHYGARHIRRKAHETSLEAQDAFEKRVQLLRKKNEK